ncbi:MAG: hypothetical protein WCA28_17005, partial [Bradyrhizobium sp.]
SGGDRRTTKNPSFAFPASERRKIDRVRKPAFTNDIGTREYIDLFAAVHGAKDVTNHILFANPLIATTSLSLDIGMRIARVAGTGSCDRRARLRLFGCLTGKLEGQILRNAAGG